VIDKDTLSLPDAPALAGLVFRRFRGPSDYGAMGAVHEGAREHDRVDPQSAREGVPTAEDLARRYAAVPPGTPDVLLAEVDGRVVGYNDVRQRWTEETGTRVYLHLGYLLPAWRGRGIGSALLHWSQARIRAVAAEERPAGPATFATNVTTTEREADALMRHAGYADVRRLTDMLLEPLRAGAAAPPPVGMTLRPIEPGDYRAVYRAWKEAFAGIWTSTPESEADYQRFLATNIGVPDLDPALYQVAWVGDEVAGLVFARIQRGVGTIPEVAVRPAWQRRGIARALMAAALQGLHDRGMTQARLATDAANGRGARSLYEGFGFREVKQYIFYRKPLDEGVPCAG